MSFTSYIDLLDFFAKKGIAKTFNDRRQWAKNIKKTSFM